MNQFAFSVPQIQYTFLLPEMILLATGLFVLLIDVFTRNRLSRFLAGLSILGTLAATVSVIINFYPPGGAKQAYMLLVDSFSSFFVLTICLIVLFTILFSISYQKFFNNISNGEYLSLLLFSSVGMMFMACAGHLILFFVGLELMSLCIYVLAGFHKENSQSIEAALKYFLLGAFASAFLLLGFAFLFGATGTLDITGISNYVANHPQALGPTWLIAGLLLTLTGLGFKISMVPFHMWTPDVYEGAPTVITGFMATGVKAAAFAGVIRILMIPFHPLWSHWVPVLWVGAFLTMTVGNILALVQKDIKRILAYSSIAHAGYLMIGLVVGSGMAQAGMLYYLLSYAFMNIGAFGVLAFLGRRGQECSTLSDVSGLGLKYPAIGLAMAIFMFSLAGIPPTAGFMGKLYIFTAAVKSGYVWLVVLGVINSAISIYYYLNVLMYMYFHSSSYPAEQPQPAGSFSGKFALFLSSFAVLFIGIFPSFFLELVKHSIFVLT